MSHIIDRGQVEVNLFNTIKVNYDYWLVDQVKLESEGRLDYAGEFARLLEEWRKEKVGYLSLLMDEKYEGWLLEKGFRKVSAIVEYTRTLDKTFALEHGIVAESLADSKMDDASFANLYERCRSGSANKNNLFTIEQVMESFEKELGSKWRTHCYIFRKYGESLGLSIPHLEEGTIDEGRLFYFGVVPEQRRQGYGAVFHRLSLGLLKNFGATTYVGSTDENNRHMICIFEKNGCSLRDKKGIYRIDRKEEYSENHKSPLIE